MNPYPFRIRAGSISGDWYLFTVLSSDEMGVDSPRFQDQAEGYANEKNSRNLISYLFLASVPGNRAGAAGVR